jgi:ABC-type uncharacterized transport system permease subunit
MNQNEIPQTHRVLAELRIFGWLLILLGAGIASFSGWIYLTQRYSPEQLKEVTREMYLRVHEMKDLLMFQAFPVIALCFAISGWFVLKCQRKLR